MQRVFPRLKGVEGVVDVEGEAQFMKEWEIGVDPKELSPSYLKQQESFKKLL